MLKNSQPQNESAHVSVVRDEQVNVPARICSWKFLKKRTLLLLFQITFFKEINEWIVLSYWPFLESIKTAPGRYDSNQPNGAKCLVSVNLKGLYKASGGIWGDLLPMGLLKKDTLSKCEIADYWRILMFKGFDDTRSPALLKLRRKDPQSRRMRKRNSVLTEVSQELTSITCIQLPTPSQQVTGTVFSSALVVTPHSSPEWSRRESSPSL